MKFDKELWEKVTEYHGHKCPGIAMGFKMCVGSSHRSQG